MNNNNNIFLPAEQPRPLTYSGVRAAAYFQHTTSGKTDCPWPSGSKEAMWWENALNEIELEERQ